MNFLRASVHWALLSVLLVLLFLSYGPAASAETPPEPARPDYATISQALDGNSAAIDALMTCADSDSDCRMVAAAALHRQGRAEDAVELLRPLLARSDPQAAQIVAELGFEQRDYRLVRAAGSIWMEANDLEPPSAEISDRGTRVAWLMGQAAGALSPAGLDEARKLAAEIRSSPGAEGGDGNNGAPTVRQGALPDAVSRTAPKYPREIVQAGAGGWAMFLLSVAADGQVEDVRELFASHDALAEKGIEAIGQWRFEPTDHGGWWTRQIIEFTLGDRSSTSADADSGVPDEQGWIAFDNARGWIEFTVRVNDVPARAMLDSGAEGNAVSRRLAERAGIDVNLADEVRVQGIYGREVVPTARDFELRLGDATVPMRDALVLPVSAPDLILGVSLFHAGVVQIDYPNKRIRFLNRDVVRFEGNVRVRTERGRSPQVAAELDGKKVWMLLDTGNAGATLFKRRLLERLELDRHVVDGTGISGFGAVSTGRKRLLQLPGFKLGPFQFESLLASYIEQGGKRGFEGRSAGYGSRIRSDDVPYDGILGSEALKDFIITMDIQNSKVHFAVP